MITLRLVILPTLALLMCVAIVIQWHWSFGFDAFDPAWWQWLLKVVVLQLTTMGRDGIPWEIVGPVLWSGLLAIVLIAGAIVLTSRIGTRTISGGSDARNTHGSARWATSPDVRRAQLLGSAGVVVGGWNGLFRVRQLRHDGPEHVLAFAPTRSGKGVSLVLPTLLSWAESALVLDIKGENYALTAGWRAQQGQRVLRFDPAAQSGSVRYNPLSEVRLGTEHQVADCQNIANMIIDPEGKGLKDFWMKEGWGWLSAAILHVLYRVRHESGRQRTATLADVHAFMQAGAEDPEIAASDGDESFKALLDDMTQFEHGDPVVDSVVRGAASGMKKRAPNERSGVHSSAKVELALYADPIVARNISGSDFRIADLMNADNPTSLYFVIPPSDIKRLRPLIRILLNQFLTRLTSRMDFEGGRSVKHYRHRLLMLLDEFTSIGKLEIFEESLAYMAGYGLKAYIIVQDMAQLQKAYGKEESISSNCHVQIAFAPNKLDTARMLSDLTGKTTLIQRKRSRSARAGQIGGNVSDSQSEVARSLMTPDECMSLPGLRKNLFGRTVPGDMLIFVGGYPPIYGRQYLYFRDAELKRRAAIPAPVAANNNGETACNQLVS